MKIALVEPYVSIDSLKSYAEKTEPSHLLGMYNLLKQRGCETELVDAYSSRLSAEELAKYLEKLSFTHAGFTVYDYHPCLSYVKQVLELLPENITTIIGGPGAIYCTERMTEILEPDWLVKGPGETAMLELFQSGFSPEGMSSEASRIGNTTVITSAPMNLDDIPFQRPYNLDAYALQASPRIQAGCIGQCVFCSGAYQKKFDYVSGENAERLFDHLVHEKRADIIAPNGPDFTAVPRKANAIVRALLKGRYEISGFYPGIRLDTFSKALDLDPEIWKTFSKHYKVNLESSIESFSPARLERLGKKMTRDFLDNILSHLAKIFEICDCKIVLGRIAVDPTVTIEELIVDCDGFRELLQRFPCQVTVGGMLMNRFIVLSGTPATEETGGDNPWLKEDYLDPSMLELQEDLLSNERFTGWCRLAEEVSDFSERNFVFDEILRVLGERAKKIQSACIK